MAPALCDSKIDAFVFVAGHPNEILHDAATSCATFIAAVAGAPIDELVASQPFFAKADIPAKMYKGTDTAQPSFGMVATRRGQCRHAGRHGIRDHQGRVRELRRFQETASGRRAHHEGRLRCVATRRRSILGAVKYFKEAGLM